MIRKNEMMMGFFKFAKSAACTSTVLSSSSRPVKQGSDQPVKQESPISQMLFFRQVRVPWSQAFGQLPIMPPVKSWGVSIPSSPAMNRKRMPCEKQLLVCSNLGYRHTIGRVFRFPVIRTAESPQRIEKYDFDTRTEATLALQN